MPKRLISRAVEQIFVVDIDADNVDSSNGSFVEEEAVTLDSDLCEYLSVTDAERSTFCFF